MLWKRILLVAVGSLTVACVAGWTYMNRQFQMYVDRRVVSVTRIHDYAYVQKVHNDYEWFARVHIQPSDGDSFLRRYPFRKNFNKSLLDGKLENKYVASCPTCWYYFEGHGHGHGPYGYALYLVREDKQQAELYELFGD